VETLGKRIVYARKRKGWSQNKLEEEAGLSLGMVSRAEHDRRAPTTETVGKLATALGVRVEWLLSGTPPMEPEEPSVDDPIPNRGRAARLAHEDGVPRAAIESVLGEKPGPEALTRSVLWWADRMRLRHIEMMGAVRSREPEHKK
jgi:transcriptional regulator with XRE-family HTH domain